MSLPVVRLAYGPGGEVNQALRDCLTPPSMLVSYVVLKGWLKHQPTLRYRDWVMDSGAFSAFNSGKVIDLDAYIKTCRSLLDSDPTLTEVFALDVIGDAEASARNVEAMWDAGVPAIPTYHAGEPEEYLREYARKYPKIALGGVARINHIQRLKWVAQCFARIYPKPVHGFGMGDKGSILSYPFHSVDASSWALQPNAYGLWMSYDAQVNIRGKKDLRPQIDYWLNIEERARAKWATEMQRFPPSFPRTTEPRPCTPSSS